MDLREEELNKLKANQHLTLGDVITVNINMLKVRQLSKILFYRYEMKLMFDNITFEFFSHT
jgi:hypothetical protein